MSLGLEIMSLGFGLQVRYLSVGLLIYGLESIHISSSLLMAPLHVADYFILENEALMTKSFQFQNI